MIGYLNTGIREECVGCRACEQACPVSAVTFEEDTEGFRYPHVDSEKCIHCNKCHSVCPIEADPTPYQDGHFAFGGCYEDPGILRESTSGGAFSAIAEGWCDENYVVFGAESQGISVFHSHTEDKRELSRYRQSKYLQSDIGSAYRDAKAFLNAGKKVLFSGTPCQIAGLRSFLGKTDQKNLLTVEVICEGVPTPHYMRRYNEYLENKYDSSLDVLEYRHKALSEKSGKWDFEVMRARLKNGRILSRDRWFNPFWSIWLKHIMSRPSCYQCPYAKSDRYADITLGDLWGVHLYCPELYNKNRGASLIICNSEKGKAAFEKAKPYLTGHELAFEDALRYQGPLRNHIKSNPDREQFMKDVQTMDYPSLCQKWADRPSIKLLWQKYVWGNRQKVWLWNKKHSGQN